MKWAHQSWFIVELCQRRNDQQPHWLNQTSQNWTFTKGRLRRKNTRRQTTLRRMETMWVPPFKYVLAVVSVQRLIMFLSCTLTFNPIDWGQIWHDQLSSILNWHETLVTRFEAKSLVWTAERILLFKRCEMNRREKKWLKRVGMECLEPNIHLEERGFKNIRMPL